MVDIKDRKIQALMKLLHSATALSNEKNLDKFGNPSALFKMKEFLKYIGVYPSKDNEDSHKRLKWLYKVRNMFAHSGTIRIKKNETFKREMEKSGSAIMIYLGILKIFFASSLLKIEDYQINVTKKNISSYFLTGRFHGQDVFDESFSEFTKRSEEAWINEGKFID